MDAKTLRALHGSIRHWQKNAKVTKSEDVHTGPSHCSLCKLFWLDNCRGCPVARHTGDTCCNGSPYKAACAALNRWKDDRSKREEFVIAAKTEISFLKSLLPKKEPTNDHHTDD